MGTLFEMCAAFQNVYVNFDMCAGAATISRLIKRCVICLFQLVKCKDLLLLTCDMLTIRCNDATNEHVWVT